MERTQTLYTLRAEMVKWDNKFDEARNKKNHAEKERANARSNEVMAIALLLSFTSAEILGSPFILGSEADKTWEEKHPWEETR
jgi:F0F1-type ATP synthase assembly protein I